MQTAAHLLAVGLAHQQRQQEQHKKQAQQPAALAIKQAVERVVWEHAARHPGKHDALLQEVGAAASGRHIRSPPVPGASPAAPGTGSTIIAREAGREMNRRKRGLSHAEASLHGALSRARGDSAGVAHVELNAAERLAVALVPSPMELTVDPKAAPAVIQGARKQGSAASKASLQYTHWSSGGGTGGDNSGSHSVFPLPSSMGCHSSYAAGGDGERVIGWSTQPGGPAAFDDHASDDPSSSDRWQNGFKFTQAFHLHRFSRTLRLF